MQYVLQQVGWNEVICFAQMMAYLLSCSGPIIIITY